MYCARFWLVVGKDDHARLNESFCQSYMFNGCTPLRWSEWVSAWNRWKYFFLGISMELLLLRRCCYYFCYFRSCQCRCDMCIWRLLKWDGSTVPSSTTKHLTKRDVKNEFGVVATFRVCRNNALRLIHYSASMGFVFFFGF